MYASETVAEERLLLDWSLLHLAPGKASLVGRNDCWHAEVDICYPDNIVEYMLQLLISLNIIMHFDDVTTLLIL